jgi:hypothetical protein
MELIEIQLWKKFAANADYMYKIVQSVSKKYSGGENYFTELDRMIKNDKKFLLSFYEWVCSCTSNPIIISGEIGNILVGYLSHENICKNPIVLVNGGLRSGADITSISCFPSNFEISTNTNFTMIDDSYYSGKTVNKVKNFLEAHGNELEDVYVFYDGSREQKEYIKSLYRYY